ncbi:FAD-dependent oxidoreductase [Streptomyces antimicrobicus]|uniref:FAD-dependent monooxygenase n=1 Tax=Streptomyces antimicrobicus TaxID=2883108 RepID=A0ABS8B383_9ACTN|nr:FAD-dependent monooxygenase [Streptomyces antimicrobicus]MCB5179078.1 FAD-dependent monooxygenase [Streptomyces antimicrobicus]
MTSPAPRTTPALPARTEVAVVGAGPTGLALAVTLAEAGVDFVLLDRQADIPRTSRAGVVHARTLEVLQELGCAAELVERGLPVGRFTVRDGRRTLLHADFGGLPTAYPYALMAPQYETEDVLRARLRALGGEIHRPYEVTGVVQDPDGVTLTTADGRTLRAAYAVGADGMHSVVREAAGIGFTGGSYPESFVLADVVMDRAPGRDEVSLTFGAEGLTVVAPLPGDRYRVVATVADAPAEVGLPLVQDLLDRRMPGRARVRELVWSSRFRVHHRVADRYRAGRLLLAGDAAHVHSPAGGQGMNTGIQDGHALGRVLADGRDLDAYEARRRPVAQRVVAFTDRMTTLATVRHPLLRATRNTFLPLLGRLPRFRTRLATELAELNYR